MLTTQETPGTLKMKVLEAFLTVYGSPWVVLNDFGGAFAMGAIGGGIWHGIKGSRNSPKVCTLLIGRRIALG